MIIDSKEIVGINIKEGICDKLCLKFSFENDHWYFCSITMSGWL